MAKYLPRGSRHTEVCPPDHRHAASHKCYQVHRCACRPCLDAALEVNRRRAKLIAYGRYEPSVVPSRGTVRRLQALCVAGWSLPVLAHHLGISRQVLRQTMNRKNTTRGRVEAVDALFGMLWDQKPPRTTKGERYSATTTTKWALAQGWVGALAWDDIDTDEQPPIDAVTDDVDEIAIELAVHGERPKLTQAERFIVVPRLHALRWSDRRIAAHLGVSDQTIFRDRKVLELPKWEQNEMTAEERNAA